MILVRSTTWTQKIQRSMSNWYQILYRYIKKRRSKRFFFFFACSSSKSYHQPGGHFRRSAAAECSSKEALTQGSGRFTTCRSTSHMEKPVAEEFLTPKMMPIIFVLQKSNTKKKAQNIYQWKSYVAIFGSSLLFNKKSGLVELHQACAPWNGFVQQLGGQVVGRATQQLRLLGNASKATKVGNFLTKTQQQQEDQSLVKLRMCWPFFC